MKKMIDNLTLGEEFVHPNENIRCMKISNRHPLKSFINYVRLEGSDKGTIDFFDYLMEEEEVEVIR